MTFAFIGTVAAAWVAAASPKPAAPLTVARTLAIARVVSTRQYTPPVEAELEGEVVDLAPCPECAGFESCGCSLVRLRDPGAKPPATNELLSVKTTSPAGYTPGARCRSRVSVIARSLGFSLAPDAAGKGPPSPGLVKAPGLTAGGGGSGAIPAVTEHPAVVTVAQLYAAARGLEPGDHFFQVAGTVVEVFDCPTCPPGAQCKPCPGDSVTLEGAPALLLARRGGRAASERFERGKRYRVRVQATLSEATVGAEACLPPHVPRPLPSEVPKYCHRFDRNRLYVWGQLTDSEEGEWGVAPLDAPFQVCRGFPPGAAHLALRHSDRRLTYVGPEGALRLYAPGEPADPEVGRCPKDQPEIRQTFFDRVGGVLTLACRGEDGLVSLRRGDGAALRAPASFEAFADPIDGRWLGTDCHGSGTVRLSGAAGCALEVLTPAAKPGAQLAPTALELRNPLRAVALATPKGWLAIPDVAGGTGPLQVWKISLAGKVSELFALAPETVEGETHSVQLLESGNLLTLVVRPTGQVVTLRDGKESRVVYSARELRKASAGRPFVHLGSGFRFLQ